MPDGVNPGDTPAAPPTATPPAPAEPAAPAAPADNPDPATSEPAPSGRKPDTNAGGETATVPSSRLREETEKRRQAEEEAEILRQQLAERETTPPAPAGDEEELDPDVEKLLDGYAKKRGLVSATDLQQRELEAQVRQDVKDLEGEYANSGIPYDHKAIVDYAKENNLPLSSKAALRAAYRDMNFEKITEQERQRAIAGNGSAGGAEKPGSRGSQPPAETAPSGTNPKERNMSRIRAARQRINA